MNDKQLVSAVISNRTHCVFQRFLCRSGLLVGSFLVALFMTGHVLAQQNQSAYKITSPLSGIIKNVYVKSGQAVKKGDLLLEYDDRLIMSNLAEAQAKIKHEKLNQSEAKKEFERSEELYDRTVLSEQELQQSRILYRRAVAQYAIAENELIHAQWNKEHIKLYAGFSGQVVEVFTYPGQYVNNSHITQTLLLIK